MTSKVASTIHTKTSILNTQTFIYFVPQLAVFQGFHFSYSYNDKLQNLLNLNFKILSESFCVDWYRKRLCGLHGTGNVCVDCMVQETFVWTALYRKRLCGLHGTGNVCVDCIVQETFVWTAWYRKSLCGLHGTGNVCVDCMVQETFVWTAWYRKRLWKVFLGKIVAVIGV